MGGSDSETEGDDVESPKHNDHYEDEAFDGEGRAEVILEHIAEGFVSGVDLRAAVAALK